MEKRHDQNVTLLLLARQTGRRPLRTCSRDDFTADTSAALKRWAEGDLLRRCTAAYCRLTPPPRSTIATAFSPDGTLLASTHGDHTVKVISVRTGDCIRVLAGHRRTPWVVRFHPRWSNVLVSGSLDYEVRIWNLDTGNCFVSHNFGRPIASLAFHPEAPVMAIASGHKLYLWEYEHLEKVARPQMVLKTRRSLRALHFHPRGLPLLLSGEVNERSSPDDLPQTLATLSLNPTPPPAGPPQALQPADRPPASWAAAGDMNSFASASEAAAGQEPDSDAAQYSAAQQILGLAQRAMQFSTGSSASAARTTTSGVASRATDGASSSQSLPSDWPEEPAESSGGDEPAGAGLDSLVAPSVLADAELPGELEDLAAAAAGLGGTAADAVAGGAGLGLGAEGSSDVSPFAEAAAAADEPGPDALTEARSTSGVLDLEPSGSLSLNSPSRPQEPPSPAESHPPPAAPPPPQTIPPPQRPSTSGGGHGTATTRGLAAEDPPPQRQPSHYVDPTPAVRHPWTPYVDPTPTIRFPRCPTPDSEDAFRWESRGRASDGGVYGSGSAGWVRWMAAMRAPDGRPFRTVEEVERSLFAAAALPNPEAPSSSFSEASASGSALEGSSSGGAAAAVPAALAVPGLEASSSSGAELSSSTDGPSWAVRPPLPPPPPLQQGHWAAHSGGRFSAQRSGGAARRAAASHSSHNAVEFRSIHDPALGRASAGGAQPGLPSPPPPPPLRQPRTRQQPSGFQLPWHSAAPPPGLPPAPPSTRRNLEVPSMFGDMPGPGRAPPRPSGGLPPYQLHWPPADDAAPTSQRREQLLSSDDLELFLPPGMARAGRFTSGRGPALEFRNQQLREWPSAGAPPDRLDSDELFGELEPRPSGLPLGPFVSAQAGPAPSTESEPPCGPSPELPGALLPEDGASPAAPATASGGGSPDPSLLLGATAAAAALPPSLVSMGWEFPAHMLAPTGLAALAAAAAPRAPAGNPAAEDPAGPSGGVGSGPLDSPMWLPAAAGSLVEDSTAGSGLGGPARVWSPNPFIPDSLLSDRTPAPPARAPMSEFIPSRADPTGWIPREGTDADRRLRQHADLMAAQRQRAARGEAAAAAAVRASVAAADIIGTEQPSRVKLRLWLWEPGMLEAPKQALGAPLLEIRDAVLCSEMCVHFSPCGRFFAACVACQVPAEAQPSSSADSSADDAPKPAPPPQVIYEARIYSAAPSTFGQVLRARAIRAAHCLTSIQFSPTSEHLLLAYGRRHISLLRSLVADGRSIIPVHTVLEVYRTSDMALVRVLPSAEDEVNAATFHPFEGGGIAYGTKEGRLRILRHDRCTPAPAPAPGPGASPSGWGNSHEDELLDANRAADTSSDDD